MTRTTDRTAVDRYRYPTVPDEAASLFTEGIDFFSIPQDVSFMGEKRPGIVDLCAETVFSGTWLDLGAGDGRYVDELMQRCDRVVALDADQSALSKLWHRTPERDRERLQLIVHNIVEPVALADESLDGVLCVGLLQYFSSDLIRGLLGEVRRLLKMGGTLILELSTEIERRPADGTEATLQRGIDYCFADACELLRDALAGDFDYELRNEAIHRKPMMLRGRPFTWSSRDVYVRGIKRTLTQEDAQA